MKYLYFIGLIFFLNCNSKREEGKSLIEKNELNVKIQRQNIKIDSLLNELDNCKKNYQAIEQVLE